MRLLKSIPLFVPLFGAYPLVYLAAQNQGQIGFRSAAPLTLVFAFAAVVAFLLLRVIARSATSAGVAVVSLVVMFFAYPLLSGWIDTAVPSLPAGGMEPGETLAPPADQLRAIALAWGAVALGIAAALARSRWTQSSRVHGTLTFASCALMAISLAPTLLHQVVELGANDNAARPGIPSRSDGASRVSRDVYFIVLDGYARADILGQYYHFDNHEFLDALRARGFRIAEQSSANYNWTFLSLGSTLNLDYLPALFPHAIDPQSTDTSVLYEGIRDNATARFLRQRGYQIVHFQSTWGATASNPHADREIKCEDQLFADEFARAVAEASWLGAFNTKASVDLADCHRANFRALGRMGHAPGPKFVFAHFVLPHHPYLFDRDGNVLRSAVVSNQFEFQKKLWEERANYVSQLQFTSRMIIHELDFILASSPQPPIIVLESDHGPGLAVGLTTAQQEAIRLANLGAYLLPDAPPDLIPPDITAVNQLRLVLGYYFDADLKALPNRHFMSPYDTPYNWSEVRQDKLVASWREPAVAAGSQRDTAKRE